MSKLDIPYAMSFEGIVVNIWALPEFFEYMNQQGKRMTCSFCGAYLPILVETIWKHPAECESVPLPYRVLAVMHKIAFSKAEFVDALNVAHLRHCLEDELVTFLDLIDFGLLVKIGYDWSVPYATMGESNTEDSD